MTRPSHVRAALRSAREHFWKILDTLRVTDPHRRQVNRRVRDYQRRAKT